MLDLDLPTSWTVSDIRHWVAGTPDRGERLVGAAFAHLEREDPERRIVVERTSPLAIDQCALLQPRMLLAGVPITLKDLIDVPGVPTRAGSRTRPDLPVQTGSTIWNRLRNAGAVLLGKAACHEFGSGGPGPDDPVNPCDPGAYVGGSSSGSAAAVARGVGVFSIGTDAGGSVRIPASYCGVIGFKPSYGAIPLDGVVGLSPTLDHAGVLARNVEDAARAFSVLSGTPPPDHTGPFGTVGIPEGWIEETSLDGATDEALYRALRTLERIGWRILAVCPPRLQDITWCNSVISLAEGAVAHDGVLRARPGDLTTFTRERLLVGHALLPDGLVTALEARRVLLRGLEEAGESVDLWLLPTTSTVAPRLERHRVRQSFFFLDEPIFTSPFNLWGAPAITLPSRREGLLPASVQLAAAPGRDADVLRAARVLETMLEATP